MSKESDLSSDEDSIPYLLLICKHLLFEKSKTKTRFLPQSASGCSKREGAGGKAAQSWGRVPVAGQPGFAARLRGAKCHRRLCSLCDAFLRCLPAFLGAKFLSLLLPQRFSRESALFAGTYIPNKSFGQAENAFRFKALQAVSKSLGRHRRFWF